MNRQLSLLVLLGFAAGLLAFYAGIGVTATFEPQKSNGESVQGLKTRVGILEAQVAALQAQIKDLASKASSRVLTIPEFRGFAGGKMPPGATEHEFNGMKYWTIPLKDSQ